MSSSVRFLPEVVDDLDSARRWYDERSEGLGKAFLGACSDALRRIERNPDWVAADADHIRSLRLHRFPYVIHHRLDGAKIVVVAIMFGGRDPSAWQERD